MSIDVNSSETPIIRKDSFILTNERYKNPKTSMLVFHFEPKSFRSIEQRLARSSIEHHSVESKDIYTIDQFFQKDEEDLMREFSKNAKFSRTSYASHESREEGEEPALSMNNKEKWEFFANPPLPFKEIYKLLGMLSHELDADISTLPWDLCDQAICASAVATNRIEKVSKKSMELGKHQDFNTEKGTPFGIPILYAKENGIYDSQFVNGATGKPLLISFMLYAADEKFNPEYGMGTVYYKNNEEEALRTQCKHMRLVFFEGDILHSIEEAKLPSHVKTWRISYVLKLLFNPKNANQSMRTAFYEFLKSFPIKNEAP